MALVLFACADPLAKDEVAVMRAGEVELIGVSGRRLYNDDVYRVPLDSGRVLHLGAATREALVLVNRGLSAATIVRLAIVAVVPGGDATAEWHLLAPTRAREQPLQAGGVRLEADQRLDFDIGCLPRGSGVLRAQLEVAWRQDDRWEARTIVLEAVAAASEVPSPTGPGPPND